MGVREPRSVCSFLRTLPPSFHAELRFGNIPIQVTVICQLCDFSRPLHELQTEALYELPSRSWTTIEDRAGAGVLQNCPVKKGQALQNKTSSDGRITRRPFPYEEVHFEHTSNYHLSLLRLHNLPPLRRPHNIWYTFTALLEAMQGQT